MGGNYEQLLEALLQKRSLKATPAEIGARGAMYRARMGEFADAEVLLKGMRAQFGGERTSVDLLWVMLAEAVLINYRDLSPLAEERIQRTYALARLFQQHHLAFIAGAWQAHFQFNRSDFAGLCRSLSEVAGSAALLSDDPDAKIRIQIVVANCLQFFGDESGARAAFRAAHKNAVCVHDRSSLDAILFNQTAFRYAYLRREWCAGEDVGNAANSLLANLSSSDALQSLYGVKALRDHIHYWRPRIKVLACQWAEALAELHDFKSSGAFSATNFHASIFSLERAMCLVNLDRRDAAREEMERVSCMDWVDLEQDELLYAVAVGRLLAAAGVWRQAPSDLEERQSQLLRDAEQVEAKVRSALSELPSIE